jgi:hypothetical protein
LLGGGVGAGAQEQPPAPVADDDGSSEDGGDDAETGNGEEASPAEVAVTIPGELLTKVLESGNYISEIITLLQEGGYR